MYDKVVKPLAALGEARAKFNENRALTLTIVSTKGASERRDLVAQIDANTAEVNKDLDEVGKSLQTPSGRATFKDLQDDLTAYRATRKQVGDAFAALFASKVKLAADSQASINGTAASSRTQALAVTAEQLDTLVKRFKVTA
jgi:hypothetical protein